MLVRPAVEAGEKLGFLPGDLAQKIDPYLRPLYDALYEMLGFEKVAKLIERNVIEIAPLAFMRGRTLNDSFVILDEAQNTTRRADEDVPHAHRLRLDRGRHRRHDAGRPAAHDAQSGLRHAIEVLKDVDGISFTFFTAEDVVRHPLVQRIVQAYEKHESRSSRRARRAGITGGLHSHRMSTVRVSYGLPRKGVPGPGVVPALERGRAAHAARGRRGLDPRRRHRRGARAEPALPAQGLRDQRAVVRRGRIPTASALTCSATS